MSEDGGQAGKKRPLVDPEEWEVSAGERVISEFHKGGLKSGDARPDEDDMDDEIAEEWFEIWRQKGAYKVLSEYHKEGAPFLDEPYMSESETPPAPGPEPRGPEASPGTKKKAVGRPGARASGRSGHGQADGGSKEKTRLKDLVNVRTGEVIAYTLYRSLFGGKPVKMSIKRENLIDMEVMVSGKEVLVDIKGTVVDIPRLSVWKVIFAYDGQQVLEIGRGVKNNVKVHPLRVLKVAIRQWRAMKREKRKALWEENARAKMSRVKARKGS